MKKIFSFIIAVFLFEIGEIHAQNSNLSKDSASQQSQKNERREADPGNSASTSPSDKKRSDRLGNNDHDFRDDSTDASVGMSGLSTTPGVSTTTGAGGLGTNENTGHNTSSDIYNIERKDSIRKARENKTDSPRKKNTNDPPK